MNQRPSYTWKNLSSVVLMVMALSWLTVSLPLVNGAHELLKSGKQVAQKDAANDNSNPLSNTIEEKSESGPVSLSEYLHDQHAEDAIEVTLINYYKCHPSDLYYAFHPELISPPPEARA